MKSVVVVQTSMGDYRDEFIRRFTARSAGRYDLRLYVGERYFGGTTRTSAFIGSHPARRRVVNWQYRDRAELQLMNYLDVLRCDVAVLELNPRILNTWLVSWARRISGRRTVLWGHAWSRAGMDSDTDRLRGRMRRAADALLLYTHSQKRELLAARDDLPAEEVHVATNALYAREDIHASPPAGASFIYVGRLVEDKKPLVLVDAFIAAAPRLPAHVVLHVVGDGPLREALAKRVAAAGLGERIVLHGHLADAVRLRELYGECLFSVSPGYVGLSAIQSLSFGRPMLLSRDEPHAPEIEALEEGFNAVFFDTDDVAALARTLERLVAERAEWESRYAAMAERCRAHYSVESMIEGFEAAIDG